MRATAEDIAKRVGCSISTVSRVLNNSASVSPKARQAVLEAVRASGSVPRVLGRRTRRKVEEAPLKRQASSLVEILVVRRGLMETVDAHDGAAEVGPLGSLTIDRFFSPEARYSNSYYRHIADGAVDELNRFRNRAVLKVASSLTSQQLVTDANDPSNRGLLLLGDYGEDTVPFLQKVRCPVVTLMTWDHQGWPDYVGIENASGIGLAFKHLYELGHRKIGYIAGSQTSGVFRERYTAFRMKLAEAGLPLREDWVVCESHIGTIQTHAERVLRMDDRPTAMLCCYDGAALAVQRAATKLGLSLPKDLSITGFDDEDIGQLCTPPLTTVRVPCHEMGRRAIQLLMMRAQAYPTERSDGCTVRVQPSLIVRESTAAPTK